MSYYTSRPMPTLDMTKLLSQELWSEEKDIISLIQKNGVLKASKPKATKKVSDPMLIGQAAYVWRMVAFQISPNPQHHCMPVCADFDIPVRSYDERRAITKKLDMLVDRIVNTVPATQWHGILRWGNALGYL